jgi:hypothetical protein
MSCPDTRFCGQNRVSGLSLPVISEVVEEAMTHGPQVITRCGLEHDRCAAQPRPCHRAYSPADAAFSAAGFFRVRSATAFQKSSGDNPLPDLMLCLERSNKP